MKIRTVIRRDMFTCAVLWIGLITLGLASTAGLVIVAVAYLNGGL